MDRTSVQHQKRLGTEAPSLSLTSAGVTSARRMNFAIDYHTTAINLR
jgi:hypothetical protein